MHRLDENSVPDPLRDTSKIYQGGSDLISHGLFAVFFFLLIYVGFPTYGNREKKNPTYRIPKKLVICRKTHFQAWNFDEKLLKMHWKLVFRMLNAEIFRLRRANLDFVYFLESILTRAKKSYIWKIMKKKRWYLFD